MECQRLLSYLSTRLSLLEAWQKLYTEYEPGDPELSDVVEVCMDQIKALDQSVNPEWDNKGKNDILDISDFQIAIQQVLEKIYKLHQNHQLKLKNHKEALVLEMKGVRKAKALSSQILTASEERISGLDTKA
ncbi:MAG: hypothetical protein GT601_18870 [Acidaminobacter sp.]|uniref:hypothetical protein n=1 Tax=Acidaminobacter sp. TaxID=1872102 RepID=UPI00137F86B8|nr:hypothetical protein [Acidaminobacter sp.]MZQ99733.1 hypothetical protein [Acidaminobacter sp.]